MSDDRSTEKFQDFLISTAKKYRKSNPHTPISQETFDKLRGPDLHSLLIGELHDRLIRIEEQFNNRTDPRRDQPGEDLLVKDEKIYLLHEYRDQGIGNEGTAFHSEIKIVGMLPRNPKDRVMDALRRWVVENTEYVHHRDHWALKKYVILPSEAWDGIYPRRPRFWCSSGPIKEKEKE